MGFVQGNATLGGVSAPLNTTTGNTLIIDVEVYDATTTSVTITGTIGLTPPTADGNTYTPQAPGIVALTAIDANFKGVRIIATNINGGNSHVLTATPNLGVSPVAIFVTEISAPAAPLDLQPAGNGSAHSDATPYLSTLTGNTAQTSEIAVACTHFYTTGVGLTTDTWNLGYNSITALNNPASCTAATGYKTLSAIGTQQSSVSTTGGTATGALSFLTTFKQNATTPTFGGEFQCSPLPVRRPAPRVDNWNPLPSLIVASIVKSVFSAPAVVPKLRCVRVEGWEPLPNLPAIKAIGWGFSCGEALALPQVRGSEWEPIPPLQQAAAAAISVEPQATLPPARARLRVDAWEPIPPLPAATVVTGGYEAQPVIPKRLRAAQADAWTPEPGFGATGFEPASLQRSRLVAVRVDGFEPLPDLIPVVLPIGLDTTPALAPARARLRVEGWNPIPALITPPAAVFGVDEGVPLPPARARVRVEGWNPIPPLPAAPVVVTGGYEPQAPPPGARARVRVEGFDPIPSLGADVVFSESPRPIARARARVEGFEPLPAPVPIPPSNWGFDQQPLAFGRRKTARPDYWCPIGDLAKPPTSVPQPYLLAAM